MSDTKEVLVDPELKEMIIQTLENSGRLHKIRAQLRAATYLALEGEKEFGTSAGSASLSALSQTETGILAIQLIRDFLLRTDMDHTLGVFSAEAGLNSTSAEEDSQSAADALDIAAVPEKPLLIQLIENYRNRPNPISRPKTADRRQHKSPRSFPEAVDQTEEVGSISARSLD
ncbi:hypothetical protein BV898_09972 [Hypsibius exemplaris]|uniref:Uncharacterized protein n=1 Tax=Hypsibius exemplaris TaxID=2072580 RepID=A0A1W0WKZ8_HYPEX|nr:hypothetical protein BV898_09972 [Hypsibius exemplaris]